MRWDALFADLEAQVVAQDEAALDGAVAEISRAESGSATLADRLRAHPGAEVRLSLTGGGLARGAVRGVGHDAVVLAGPGVRRTLVPLRGVVAVTGLGRAASPHAAGAVAAPGLRQALRALGRAREPVRVITAHMEVDGVIQRVGADHVDVSSRVPGGDLDVLPGLTVVALPAVVSVVSRP